MTDTFFFGPNYYHPEFEFEDTALKETYWWGCASCMVQTGKDRDDYNTGAYSMGELRSVVILAKLAEQTLDTAIYVDERKCHTPVLPRMANCVLHWFEDEADDFPIPQCTLTDKDMLVCTLPSGETKKADLTAEFNEQKRLGEQFQVPLKKDCVQVTSFVEAELQKQGTTVPRLEMIAMRKIHASGLALSASDPSDVFHCSVEKEGVEGEEGEENNDTTATLDLMSFCALCGAVPKNGSKLMRCSSCKRVKYCSKACQSIDWKKVGIRQYQSTFKKNAEPHRLFCKQVKALHKLNEEEKEKEKKPHTTGSSVGEGTGK